MFAYCNFARILIVARIFGAGIATDTFRRFLHNYCRYLAERNIFRAFVLAEYGRSETPRHDSFVSYGLLFACAGGYDGRSMLVGDRAAGTKTTNLRKLPIPFL